MCTLTECGNEVSINLFYYPEVQYNFASIFCDIGKEHFNLHRASHNGKSFKNCAPLPRVIFSKNACILAKNDFMELEAAYFF